MIEENKTTFEQDILVAHPGTHHSYMTATAVQELGRLNRYVTSFYLKRGNWWGRTLRSIGPIRRGAARRFSPFLDETKVHCIPQYELVEKLIDRSVCRKRTDNKRVFWRDRAFDRRVARRYANETIKVAIGYPNACRSILRRVKENGGTAILDLPIGDFRSAERLFTEEKKLAPEFADSITFSEFDDTYRQRVSEEMELADYILVPSEFVRKTDVETGIAPDKVRKIPYGSWLEPVDKSMLRYPKGDLSLIFFGQISQRKGLKYLLDAVRSLRGNGLNVRVTLAGNMFGNGQWQSSYADCFDYVGMVPRQRLRDLLLKHDIFVFPTLFEGSAYVIPESLAHGLPVITTENSGGDSLSHGENGFIVPVRNVESIVRYLLELNGDREKLWSMKCAALESSKEITWHRYRENLRCFLQNYASI